MHSGRFPAPPAGVFTRAFPAPQVDNSTAKLALSFADRRLALVQSFGRDVKNSYALDGPSSHTGGNGAVSPATMRLEEHPASGGGRAALVLVVEVAMPAGVVETHYWAGDTAARLACTIVLRQGGKEVLRLARPYTRAA